ncbi:MAG TPA: HlyD family efflux transporter periplasmic adaptor subunit, partial [Sphingomicrobium sp.]|nr:HlyD family efflux transporter periplasmic adaptor subunit [Sphingomicrobium sp.]
MRRNIISGPRILLALLLAALAVAIVIALREPPISVELGTVSKGPLTVTIDDLGETRVRDLYVVAAPITGQLRRVPLKPGDRAVAHATLLARIEPVEPGPLDARTYAQAQANIRSLESQLAANRSRIGEAEAELVLAERDFVRASELERRGFVTKASLDRARAARDRGRAAVAAARQSSAAVSQDLVAARAALLVSGSRASGRGAVNVTTPVSGFVLRVPQESERVVVAGTPLVEIGDPDRLELVTDLLSEDAVRIQPGAQVFIENWGGERSLKGKVRLIEPFGFTKISALGVEEQRANVIIDFAEPREAWKRMGHGYRARVRIVTWSTPSTVKVPISALFRFGNRWSLFLAENGRRARLVPVQVGRMNDEEAEIRSGVE